MQTEYAKEIMEKGEVLNKFSHPKEENFKISNINVDFSVRSL